MSNEHNNAPAVPTDSDPTSKEQYRRMFVAACEALGAISDALGCDPEDGGAEPILGAVEELQISLGLSNGILGCLSAAPAVPQGAIVNGRIYAERLEMEGFEDGHGHRMTMCSDWHELRRCFEHLAEFAQGGATPAPAPAQEVATLSLAAEDVHSAFAKNFPKSRISQAWINFAADIAQAIAARAAKPAQEVGLTDSSIDCIVYEHTKLNPNQGADRALLTGIRHAVRDIIAALRVKGVV